MTLLLFCHILYEKASTNSQSVGLFIHGLFNKTRKATKKL